MTHTTLKALLAATLGAGLLFAGAARAERPMAERGDHYQRGHVSDSAKHGRHDNRRHDRHDNRRYTNSDHRHRDRHDRRHNRYDYRRDNRYGSRHDRHYRAPSYSYYRSPSRAYRHYSRHVSPWRYVHPRGYTYRSYRSGYYLPRPYFSNGYYVDYDRYGLYVPPYGYHWVRVDGDVVLAAIASGLIIDVVHDLFY